MTHIIQTIGPSTAAPPGAHYSLGMRTGSLVYTAGCVGVDPKTGVVVTGGLEPQIEQAIRNVQAILVAAGTDLPYVLKTTCFVTRRDDFLKLDPVYSRLFPDNPPARTTVVCDLVHESFLFEIEAVAAIP